MAETLSLHGCIASKGMLNLVVLPAPPATISQLLPTVHYSLEVHRTSPQTLLSFFSHFLAGIPAQKDYLFFTPADRVVQSMYPLNNPGHCGTSLKLSPSETEVKN